MPTDPSTIETRAASGSPASTVTTDTRRDGFACGALSGSDVPRSTATTDTPTDPSTNETRASSGSPGSTVTTETPHDGFMRAALAEARKALDAGEVPVGAVVVLDGQIVGRGFNQPISATDPTAHAEVMALRDAARSRANYRLVQSTLYVTIEPCLMCVGAMVHARVGTLVFGALEPKAGAIVSSCQAHENPALNHRIGVISGVLEDECRGVIQEFFKGRRGKG